MERTEGQRAELLRVLRAQDCACVRDLVARPVMPLADAEGETVMVVGPLDVADQHEGCPLLDGRSPIWRRP